MKLQRLLAILSLLCERDKATAQELADRFEVSKRTILRDIETLFLSSLGLAAMVGSPSCRTTRLTGEFSPLPTSSI